MPGTKTNPEAAGQADGITTVDQILELAKNENFIGVVILGERAEGGYDILTDGGTSLNDTNWALDQAKRMVISGEYDVEPTDGTDR